MGFDCERCSESAEKKTKKTKKKVKRDSKGKGYNDKETARVRCTSADFSLRYRHVQCICNV